MASQTSTSSAPGGASATGAPPPLAITMGDAAGIGPEIVARAFAGHPELTAGAVVFGDAAVMRRAAAVVAGHAPAGRALPLLPVLQVDSAAEAAQVPPRCMAVLQVGDPIAPPPWGRISAEAGRAAALAVQAAARAALRGEVAALVTAPLNKEALAAAGAPFAAFPGHTELLQAEAAAARGVAVAQMPVRMMLASDELRTVLVSIHVSLREAIDAVTTDNVLQTLRIAHASLGRLLGRAPRLAVAGLNPHAGEGGLFGREEIDLIAPAIARARAEGMEVSDPLPPDTVFMRARHAADHAGEFDAVIAMYHDQGLIPVKYLGLEQGVNVTLGLPLVRTSPDHGTAFDIAGTGRADAASLCAALRMARRLAGLPVH